MRVSLSRLQEESIVKIIGHQRATYYVTTGRIVITSEKWTVLRLGYIRRGWGSISRGPIPPHTHADFDEKPLA